MAIMEHSTYVQDICVIAFMAFCTVNIRSRARKYFERNVPEWEKLDKDVQSRLSVEIAAIPMRVLLVYFTYPIVASGFEPIATWKACDTEACIRAWYAF